MLRKTLSMTFLALAAAQSAQAVDVYGGVGTTGFLVGIENHYSDSLGVRADLNAVSLSRSESDSSATYQGNLHLAALGVFGDYHPWGNGFRVSAGALIGDSYLNGTAVTSNGAFTLNGIQVSAPGETLTANVRLPSVRPVLGIGWGHAPTATGTFMQFDLGVAYGRPNTTLVASPGLVAAAAAAGTSVAAEQALLQSKVNDYKLFPIARAALGWAW
jgi:hypothetical protein